MSNGESKWWISIDGEVSETPYTTSELSELESFTPDTLVQVLADDESDDWKPASDFDELRSLFEDEVETGRSHSSVSIEDVENTFFSKEKIAEAFMFQDLQLSNYIILGLALVVGIFFSLPVLGGLVYGITSSPEYLHSLKEQVAERQVSGVGQAEAEAQIRACVPKISASEAALSTVGLSIFPLLFLYFLSSSVTYFRFLESKTPRLLCQIILSPILSYLLAIIIWLPVGFIQWFFQGALCS
jgi:hypothetical protein